MRIISKCYENFTPLFKSSYSSILHAAVPYCYAESCYTFLSGPIRVPKCSKMAIVLTIAYTDYFRRPERNIQTIFSVYCPECPPGGTIGHPGGQLKKFLPFGHGRDLVAFNGTGL